MSPSSHSATDAMETSKLDDTVEDEQDKMTGEHDKLKTETKAEEDLNMELAKWYEDFAAYVLSRGGRFLVKDYAAGAGTSPQLCAYSTFSALL